MGDDRHARPHEIPFDTLAGVLGIDLSKFKPRQGRNRRERPALMCGIAGFVNLDGAVSREFRVGADKRLELRVEVFNVANAVHLGPPNVVIDEPGQAGRITSTQAPPRQAQLGLRFVF